MKTQLLTSFIALLLAVTGFSQTQFWSDNFEDVGAPSSGTRTPSVQNSFGSPATRYFFRTDNTTAAIAFQSGSAYTGVEGSKMWAAEDIDAALTGANFGQSSHQNITWSGINISGKSGMSFKGLFACNQSGAVWESNSIPADYMIVEYRIDGGAWTSLTRLFTNGSGGVSGAFAVETTGDSIAFAEGAVLPNATFTELTGNIIGTGTTLDLRFKCSANGTGTEELAIDNFRLFETPACTAPVITANPPNRSICAGNNTTFPCTATGATAYQWQVDNGGGFVDITNGGVYSNATTATLTITGATAGMNGYLYRCKVMNGVATCFTNTNSGTLNISSISTASASQTNVSCNGGSNGAASVSPSGGIGGYTYSWSPSGGTGSIATGLTAGSYTVTVTDGLGCTATRNYTITQPPVLNGTTVVTNVACFGGNTGAINLTASGGSPGYTYSWVSGPTTEDRTGLTAGTYSVTITDANSCTKVVSGITVTQPASAVSGTTVVTNVACFGGNTGAINLTPAGGTAPYTFNWGSGITSEDRTTLTAGTYSVQITDANGCIGTVNATVTQPSSGVSGTTVVTNVACFGGNTGAINLTPTGGAGPYTFNWGSGVTSEDRTNLIAGTYSVTITDANGCTGSVSPTVTQPAAPVSGTTVVTNVACFGGNTGAINLTPTGGVGPYTFNWLPSGPTTEDRTGLVAGTYSVQITDANGCTGTVNATVTQPASAVSGTTIVTNVACFGGNTGAINLTPTGGTGPYTFNWLPSGPTTEDRTGLVAGTYSVQITDANGCTGTVNATVTQPASAVSGTTVVTNVACFGGNNGAINLTPTGGTGPYTFNWLPSGPTTEDRSGLFAGTYSVQITDANGCTGTVNATVTQPASAVSGTTVVTNVACFGGNTGAINLTPTGGVGPYTFNWVGGSTSEDRTNLTAGTYFVTITDANGCTGTVNATVTQPAAPVSGTTVVTNVACFGGNTGAINLTPTGGVGPYTFNWVGGATTEDRTGLTAGTYSVTITDANGCTGTVNATVTQPSAPVSGTTVVTDVSCFGGSNGTINLTPTGGVGPYTFNWVGGATTEDRTGLIAGNYSVTITDANGCTGTVSGITVTQPSSSISGTTVVTNVACFGGNTGAINLTPTGGVGSYTFDWGSGVTTEDRTGLIAGTYSVTITDANGCTGTVNATVTEPSSAVSGTTVVTNIACFGGSTGAINLTPTGGVGPYTFDWGSGITTEDRTSLTAGTYSVTITDANGCTGTVNATVTQPAAPVSGTTVVTNVSCFGGSNGAINLTPTGGVGPYTFDWGSGITTEDRTGLSDGVYSVTITDANGCSATINVTVTQPASALSGTTVVTDVTCFGGSNGSIVVTPSGGTPNYVYSWSPSGGTGQTASGLTAGPYTVTITDANGCQATVSATVTEPAQVTSSFSASACASYTWNSQTYTTSGTYTQTLTTVLGCDSIVTLNLTITPTVTSSFSAIACDSYTWNSQTYTTSGTYTQTFPAASGCDSVVTLTLTINVSPSTTFSATACDSYTWNAQTYTASGTYTQTFTTAGCDSTVTLNLTINQSTPSSMTVTECDSYTLNGQTYTSSGTYTQLLSTTAGCDSVLTLNLTILQSSSSSVSATACGSYTWNTQTYTTSGTYTQVLQNAAGCDSVVTLNLTILSQPTTFLTQPDPYSLHVESNQTVTYQWIDCGTNQPVPGATSATFTTNVSGAYAVIVSNGVCSTTSSCAEINLLGITDYTDLNISLVPNPASDLVKLTFDGAENAAVVIYDAQGNMVITTQVLSGENISVEKLVPGVYLVNVVTGNGAHTERLIKQ